MNDAIEASINLLSVLLFIGIIVTILIWKS